MNRFRYKTGTTTTTIFWKRGSNGCTQLEQKINAFGRTILLHSIHLPALLLLLLLFKNCDFEYLQLP